ncbi:MAG TPA: hypothetical protein VMO81_07985 [Aestuariivirgaceae bacterium]|nr:hypothetical protein [Aestuariivirgaceae bacterium]
MSGHPHWRGQATARPGRSGFRPARAARRANIRRSRSPRPSHRGLVAFAAALTVALGTVVTMIATSSVQALAEGAMFNDSKSDSWVGMAAVGSVLVCALIGMVIVHRYNSTRDR